MNSTRQLWLIVALTLLAFALRVYRLDAFALRGDESFTVQFSSLPAAELFEGIRSVEPNPPLYYYALRGWMSVAGSSDFAARYFSLFFGVLLVPLLYVLGRMLAGPRVGLIAAALLAFNPFQIYHSQDVRNYTIWPALTILASWLLWRALRHGRPHDWIGYGLASLLALYTHYFTLFIIVAENLFAALIIFGRGLSMTAYANRRRRLLLTWVAVQSVLVAGFLAWLSIGSTRALTSISAGSAPALLDMLRRTMQALLIGESVPRSEALWLLILPLALVIVGGVLMARRQVTVLLYLLLTIGVPVASLYLAIQTRPLYEPRYLNIVAPSLYILAAAGIVGLAASRRWRAAAAVGVGAWLIIAVYAYGQAQFNPRFAKSPDWRGRAAYLEQHQQAGDVIIMNYPDPSLGYYYRGAAPLLYVPTGYLDEARRTETEQTLQGLLRDYRRIWLLPQKDPNWDNDGTVERRLQRSADRVWAGTIAGQNAQLYETPQSFGEHYTIWPVSFEHGIRLLGYRLSSERVRAGDSLELVLYWQATQGIPQDFNVFTHVLDDNGAVRAQQDNAPARGALPTTQWPLNETIVDAYEIKLPADLPPGEYGLAAGLYDWMTGVRLKTETGDEQVRLPVKVRVE